MMKKKVLLIGLDGVRPDAVLVAKTPTLKGLAKEGLYSWHAQTEIHTISGPAWTSLLTGVHADKHRVFDNDFKPRDLKYRTFFSIAKDWNPQLRVVAHSHWKPILTEIFEKKVLSKKSSGPDKLMAWRMAKSIQKDEGDLYFIQLDDCDHAGHQYVYSPTSVKYLDQLAVTDTHVAQLMAAVRSRPSDEDWLICVVSDHGGEGKSLGMPAMGALTIIFIIVGNWLTARGEIPGREEEAPQIVDMVPTLAKFLGMPPDSAWDGTARGI